MLWLVLLGFACETEAALSRCEQPLPQRRIAEQSPVRSQPSDEVTLAFAGDAMLARGVSVQQNIELWHDLENALHDVDVFAFNLETTVGESSEKWPDKEFNFQASPTAVENAFSTLPMAADGSLYVSLANNHILDFGESGLLESISYLQEFEVSYSGAGQDQEQAKRAEILTIGTTTIGFLSAADHCGCDDVCAWAATEQRPGMWYIDTKAEMWDDLLLAVEDLSPQVDWLVVSLHWGPNWSESPQPRMKRLAAALVEAGADIIHGHSAHHVLPLESIAGKTVIYGSGGLIDDYAPVEGFRNDLSFLTRIRLLPSRQQEVEIVPLKIEHRFGHYVRALSPTEEDYQVVIAMSGGVE